MDELKEECGVFGIFGHPDASPLTSLGLYALQHRGQESAGIVTVDREGVARMHRGMGLVSETFDEATLAMLPGDLRVIAAGQTLTWSIPALRKIYFEAIPRRMRHPDVDRSAGA